MKKRTKLSQKWSENHQKMVDQTIEKSVFDSGLNTEPRDMEKKRKKLAETRDWTRDL